VTKSARIGCIRASSAAIDRNNACFSSASVVDAVGTGRGEAVAAE
jgi:hypothetical protein